jgi:hypothetical protein
MNLQMSEGLQLNSRGFPFKGGTEAAPLKSPGVPVSTAGISDKMRRPLRPAMVVDCSIFWQV